MMSRSAHRSRQVESRNPSGEHSRKGQRLIQGMFFALLLTGFAEPYTQASAAEDPRTAITLPADTAADFLAEMRVHMANLDDIVAALAENDFKQAARIAELRMTMGHHRWAAMEERGATDAEIAAARENFKKRYATHRAQMRSGQGMEQGTGQGMGRGAGMGAGMGPGIGRFMPEDFWAMGNSFHEAAEVFAETAKSVSAPAKPYDYTEVLEQLQEVTAACRACHDAFRVEVAR